MFSKLRILAFLFFACVIQARAQNVKIDSVSPRLVVKNCYEVRYSTKYYRVLSVYLVNNSNDTLKYWGNKQQFEDLFTIVTNENLSLYKENESTNFFEQIVIPPLKSQHILLRLTVLHRTDSVMKLRIKMNYYNWFGSNDFQSDRKNHPPQILSDKIEVRFDRSEASYLSESEWIEKEKLILPSNSSQIVPISWSAKGVKQKNASPRLIVDNCYKLWKGDTTKVLSVYIVNPSDDTLKVWGTRRRFNNLFEVTGSENLSLLDDDVIWHQSWPLFERMSIPPGRSLRVQLKLVAKNNISGLMNLKVNMKFYHCLDNVDFAIQKKYYNAETLTDTLTVMFNETGDPLVAETERSEKEKLNLPSADFYPKDAFNEKPFKLLLDERENISLSIYTINFYGMMEVSGAGYYKYDNFNDKDKFDYKMQPGILVPVTIYNNSDFIESYTTMSCSWDDDYYNTNQRFAALSWPCEKNIYENINVPPHTCRTQTLIFVNSVDGPKHPEFIRIGLDVQIGGNPMERNYLSNAVILWSNEVRLKVN